MLYRKFARRLEDFLNNEPRKILLVNGARQIGKSYIIRYVGKQMFKNFVEINLKADKEGMGIFQSVRSVDDFYLQLGAIAGDKLGNKQDTIVFLDEIQSYPHLMTMLKFLNEEGKYRYIASGSELGVALAQTPSVPIGSIAIEQMYPLDFEEFLLAMGCGQNTIDGVRRSFENRQSLNDSMHNYMLQQFKLYLLVGGMPDLIPSNMENKKKRIIVKNIEGKSGHKQYSDYAEEFEYLTNSGVVLQVRAISNPKFPLLESESKNLLKLYLSDVGLLTNLLFGTNVNAVLGDVLSINLGSVYESVVAQELHAHGFQLHYYDNKQRGEVDFLIDDYDSLTVLPIEVKSGKDYKVHSALDRFIATPDYHISRAVVLSNEQKVYDDKGITYMPVYYVMFFKNLSVADSDCIIPEIPTVPE